MIYIHITHFILFYVFLVTNKAGDWDPGISDMVARERAKCTAGALVGGDEAKTADCEKRAAERLVARCERVETHSERACCDGVHGDGRECFIAVVRLSLVNKL